jgi:hypothetical protein
MKVMVVVKRNPQGRHTTFSSSSSSLEEEQLEDSMSFFLEEDPSFPIFELV